MQEPNDHIEEPFLLVSNSLVHPGLMQFRISVVLLDATEPSLLDVVCILGGVELESCLDASMRERIRWLMIPLHRFVFGEHLHPERRPQSTHRPQRVMPFSLGALGYTGMLEQVPRPIVCKFLVELLIVSEASIIVLVVYTDEWVKLLRQKPKIITLGFRNGLWGSRSVLELFMLDRVVVLLDGLVLYDVGGFDGSAASIKHESNRCDTKQQGQLDKKEQELT